MPHNSLIVAVDLAPIKPIPRVISFQGDITTDKTRAVIRSHFKTWKADTVLHVSLEIMHSVALNDQYRMEHPT